MLSWHTNVNYDDLRFEVISNVEGVRTNAYVDSAQLPSIGIGFNLRDAGVFNSVLAALQIGGAGDAVYINQLRQAVAAQYPIGRAGDQALQNAVNGVMAQRAQATGNPRTTFTMTNAEMQQVFATLAPRYEQQVDARIPDVPESAERVALFSLAYNSVAGRSHLIGPSLIADINRGDRAEAWFEIRYRSNADQVQAKRRYYESQVFGLYEAQSQDPDVEYKSIFAMYARRETQIIQYDRTYGNTVALASRDYHANVQPTTRAAAGGGRVQDLTGALSAAANFLIANYAPGQRIEQVFAGSNSTASNPLGPLAFHTLDRSNDGTNVLLLGSEGADTLRAGSGKDYLYGGAGDDVLFGYAGANPRQIDVMVGGDDAPGKVIGLRSGNDTLTAGSGFNLMIGDDQNASFVVNTTQFPRNFNIIWGEAVNASTYNFTGNSQIFLVNVLNATMQSVTQFGNSNAAFEAFFTSRINLTPSTSNTPITIIINPNRNDTFVINGRTIPGSQFIPAGGVPSGPAIQIAVGDNQNLQAAGDLNAIYAVGDNIAVDTQSFNVSTLVALGSNDTFKSSDPRQVIIADQPTGSISSGNDTLTAGGGGDILIGNSPHTVFKIDGKANPGSIIVVWDKNGGGTIDIKGGANVYEIRDSKATLKSVSNLNLEALADAVITKAAKTTLVNNEPVSGINPINGVPIVIVINPSDTAIKVDGKQIKGARYGSTGTSSTNFTDPARFDVLPVRVTPTEVQFLPAIYDYQFSSSSTSFGLLSKDGFDYNIRNSPSTENAVKLGRTQFVGFANGDFGITITGNGPALTGSQTTTFIPLPRSVTFPYGTAFGSETLPTTLGNVIEAAFFNAATPTFNLLQYQGNGSPSAFSGAGGGGSGGGGEGFSAFAFEPSDDPERSEVTDVFPIFDSYVIATYVTLHEGRAFGSFDTLIATNGNNTFQSFGSNNTLIAGPGVDTLFTNGSNDLLIGNANGSTLDGSFGFEIVAAYTIDNVTVDLGAGTATVNGSGVSDTLIGIDAAAALGTHDTLIGGTNPSTLYSNVGDNTLIAGSGDTTVIYDVDEVTVDLAGGTASITGGDASDTLIGILNATVQGDTAVVIGDADGATLRAEGTADTLITSGADNTLIAAGDADLLISSGSGNTLQIESGLHTLVSTGAGDIFLSDGQGSTLDASGGTGAVATYESNFTMIDLSAGTAGEIGSDVFDTLIGFDAAAALGFRQIVIGGSGGDTLSSSGFFNTLIAGEDADTLISTGLGDTLFGNLGGSTLDGSGGDGTVVATDFDDVTIDLTTGTAYENGSSLSDTLIGITTLLALGSNDTLIASDGNVLIAAGDADLLLSGGEGNTLVDESGNNTLVSSGIDDTFIAIAAGSTLDASAGTGTTLAYEIDDLVVDLGAGTAIDAAETPDILIGIHTVAVSGANNTLIGGLGSDELISTGQEDDDDDDDDDEGGSHAPGNTLIAAGGADTLTSQRFGDVLYGNAEGSTLDGSDGEGTMAAYALDNVTADLGSGTATVNGSGVSDTLIGITTLTAFGVNDTLIGGDGLTTLIGRANGNTLIGGSGETHAFYGLDDVTLNLAAGTAVVAGGSLNDTLLGITVAEVAGNNDTAIAGSGTETLIASGTFDTLIGGAAPVTLMSNGASNVLMSGSAASKLTSSGFDDTLIAGAAADVLSTNGFANTLIGGSGATTLTSEGASNILIAGSGANTLTSVGANDTLFGNVTGSTLIGGAAAQSMSYSTNSDEPSDPQPLDGVDSGTVAAYAIDNATIDLGAGTATVNGSGVSDTILGILRAAAYGTGDTLIGSDSAASTLISNAAGNTLVAGDAPTVASYSADNVTIDMSAGTATVNGSGLSDTLIGIVNANAAGQHSTLLAGSGTQILSSNGANNSLIAGVDAVTLISTLGLSDTLFGNANGSTLRGRTAALTYAAYTMDDVTVDLANGTATVNGSFVSDTLIGIRIVEALGTNDTLIADFGPATLFSNAAGNTLIAGEDRVFAAYTADDMTIDLVAGTAAINGSEVSDTLIGVRSVMVSGENDTLVSDAGGNTLVAAEGSGALVSYAVDDLIVDLNFGVAGIDGDDGDTLVGINRVLVSGANNIVIAGAGDATLIAAGADDTLVGSINNNVLQATEDATGTVAFYEGVETVVDLGAGLVTSGLADTSDVLIGIFAATVAGTSNTILAGDGADVLSSVGESNTLIGGSGAASLSSSGFDDTLLGGSGANVLFSDGEDNVLVAGSAANLLTSAGFEDTLFGTAAGNTLDASEGFDAIAAYAIDDVTVDLSAGTASVNGSGASDTLIGITAAAAFGSNDTLTAGDVAATLMSSGSHNTLLAGSETDTLSSSGSHDVLIGAEGDDELSSSGFGNTLIAGADENFLSSSGFGDTLMAGSTTAVLFSDGQSNTLIGGSGEADLSTNGTGDTLIGGSAGGYLSSGGLVNTLIAGSSLDYLETYGEGDTLFGTAAGNTLDAVDGIDAVAAYALDDVTVDLDAGTASVNGSGAFDTLIAISAAAAYGAHDTLIAGASAATLISAGSENTLIAGGADDTLQSSGTNDTLLGGAGADMLSSSGFANTLIAGDSDNVLSSEGTNDTLIAGSTSALLTSSGFSNTLIGGSGNGTLSSTGTNDLLFGNATGNTLVGSDGIGAVAAYSLDHVTVDLAAGSATVNGSGVSDTLVGISAAAAFGTDDTLLGGAGITTLISNAEGNTLISGTGQTVAAYAVDNVTVDLTAGSASAFDSSASDLLVGISAVALSGFGGTVIGSSGTNILSSSGFGNTLIAGSANDTLSSSGGGDTLVGNALGATLDASAGGGTVAAYAQDDVTVDLAEGSASVNGSGVSDTLIGVFSATVSGDDATLIGSMAEDTLHASGSGDTVLAGEGDDVLLIDSGSTFYGGDGIDSFVVSSAATSGSGHPQNLIGDFDPNSETIDLTRISDVGSFADLSFSTVTFGGQDYLQIGLGSGGQVITLADVTANELSADDFIFSGVTPTSTAASYSVANASSVPQGQDLSFTVTRTQTSAATETLTYSLDSGATTQTVDFTPSALSAIITVPTAPDTDNVYGDAGETVMVTLVSVTGGGSVSTTPATGIATDTTAAPVYSIADTPSVSEGGDLTFTVSRTTDDATGSVVVGLNFSGTATAGTDYTTPGATVTFDTGDLTKTVTVHTSADGYYESDESVVVSLTTLNGGAGSISGTANATTGTIIDATAAPSITSQTLASDTGASATDYITKDGHVSLAGTVSAGSTVAIFNGTTMVGNASVTGSSWTFSTDLAEGLYDLYAVATDGLAGTASSLAGQTIVVDKTAPTPVISSILSGPGGLTFSGNSDANSTVRLLEGTVLLGTVSATLAGIWSLLVPTPSNAVHTYTVSATDVAGNIGTGDGVAQYGSTGGNTLTGTTGADLLIGNKGNDTFVVDNAGDVVVENPAEGTDTVRTSLASYTLTDNVENLVGLVNIGQTLIGNALGNSITAAGGADTLIGNSGNDVLNGGAGADVLVGNDGNDTLDGGANADTMSGGLGNDTYIVDDAGDAVVENATEGTDIVKTAIASYALTDNVENLTGTAATGQTLAGNALANSITGGAGNDTLAGGDGNDTLNGGAGADAMSGGLGNDTYTVDDAGDAVSENAAEGTDTVKTALASYALTDNVENLTGTAATGQTLTGNALANSITGGGGNDTLNGGDGNDTLNGGVGADAMSGGTGNDTYTVDNAGDTVTENSGEGTDTVKTALASYTLGSNVENLTGTAATGQTLTGNELANTITGGAGDDTIAGADGNDILNGGTGDDTLTGGDGNDTLTGGTGGDSMSGGAGNDTYTVDDIGDVVVEAAGEGTDLVKTVLASYTLGDEVENLTGTATTGQTLTGNALANSITGGTGNDTLAGGDGVDTLNGGNGNDTLLGGDANDTLTGSGGNDVLDGGTGADRMTGGTGDDSYVVDNAGDVVVESANAGTDTVQTSLATYTLTNNVENLIGVTSAQTLNGNTLANDITAGGPNDTLAGRGGYDTYRVGANMGHAVVNNTASDGVTTARGEVDFGTGIADTQLWFERSGNDLQIDLMGTNDHLTISGWYAGNARAQVSSFNTADGLKLDTQIAQLVTAMATFSANNPGFDPTQASQIPNDPTLQSVVAASWHS